MTKKAKKVLEWSIIAFLAVILLLSVSLFFYQKAYAGKIYRNVYLDNLNLSGKTRKQAVVLIENKFRTFSEQQITIESNEKEVKAYIKDTGLSIDSQKIADECYLAGRDQNFFRELYKSSLTTFSSKKIISKPTIDKKKYDQFVQITVNQLNFDPKDATIIIENGNIKESEGVGGQVVDTANLPEQITNLADKNNKIITLNSKTVAPKFATSNFAEAKASAEVMLSKKITFSYEDKNFSPSRSEIGLWINFLNKDGSEVAELNETNVKAYLNKIAKDFEIEKKDRKINAANGSVIEEGVQGKYLEKNAVLTQIKNQIHINQATFSVAMTTYTQDPAEIKVFPNEGVVPGRYEGKYIDVDLANQKLCRIEGTNILDCYTISSGKSSMPTPTGSFNITSKNPKQWSNKYGLWMPWWQQFNGDYGLHELPIWPNGYQEGEAHLGTPVSHGCVRMGPGTAEMVYNWTEIGTPVYIHK